MILKLTTEFLKNKDYKEIENTSNRVVFINTSNAFIVTQLVTGHTIIAESNKNNIKFKGIIHNLQEFKSVLNLISRTK